MSNAELTKMDIVDFREKVKSGYILISNKLLKSELTGLERLVFISVGMFFDDERGYAYPTYEDLLDTTGIKDKITLINHVKNLIKKDFIRKETVKGIGCKYFFTEKGSKYLVTKSEL